MRRKVAVLVFVAFYLLGPAALFLVGFLSSRRPPAALDLAERPIYIEAKSREVEEATAAKLVLKYGETREVLGPSGWRGVVTAVYVQNGKPLATGDRVLQIDYVDRVANWSPAPLVRELGLGDAGKDVLWLEEALIRLDMRSGVADDYLDGESVLAIRRLSNSLGFQVAADRFDPGWFVWIHSPSIVVAESALVVARTAPAAGSAIFKTSRDLLSAQAVSLRGEPLKVTGESRSFVTGSKTLALNADLSVQQTMLGLVAPPNDSDEVVGEVKLQSPRRVVFVPSASVVEGDSGKLCMYVRAPDDANPVAKSVVVRGGEIGTAYVEAGVEAGERVLANPRSIAKHPRCP